MKERNFDALLDGVLREDAGAEPRDGFEARMLAQVGAASAAVSRRWMFAAWAGGLTVVAGMVALIVLLPGRHEVRTVPHDGLAASVEGRLPSGAKAPSAGTVYGTAEAVPLSKTGLSPDDVSQGVSAEKAAVSRQRGASGKHVVQAEEAALPKLDVFPSPAPVDVFPTSVGGSEHDREVAALVSSPEALAELVSLKREQEEPVRVAAIEIAPLGETE